jgi:hypothetical protein
MNREQIIQMWKDSGDIDIVGMPYSKIERFAKLVAEHEREACAKVCEDIYAWNMDDPASTAVTAIRARGQT